MRLLAATIETGIKGIPRYLLAEGTDNDQLHIHVSEVGPGSRSHAPHIHDGREIFYVLDGTAEIEVGDDRYTLASGEAAQVNCTVPHGIRNAGEDALRYAVIIAH